MRFIRDQPHLLERQRCDDIGMFGDDLFGLGTIRRGTCGEQALGGRGMPLEEPEDVVESEDAGGVQRGQAVAEHPAINVASVIADLVPG